MSNPMVFFNLSAAYEQQATVDDVRCHMGNPMAFFNLSINYDQGQLSITLFHSPSLIASTELLTL